MQDSLPTETLPTATCGSKRHLSNMMAVYNDTGSDKDFTGLLPSASAYKKLDNGQINQLVVDQAYINSLIFRQDHGPVQVKKDDPDQMPFFSVRGRSNLFGSSSLESVQPVTTGPGLSQTSPMPVWHNGDTSSLLMGGSNANPKNYNVCFDAMYLRDVAMEPFGLGDGTFDGISPGAATISSHTLMESLPRLPGALPELSGGNVFTGYQEPHGMESQGKNPPLSSNDMGHFMFPSSFYQAAPMVATPCGSSGIDGNGMNGDSVELKFESPTVSPPISFDDEAEADFSFSDASMQFTSQSPCSPTSPNSSGFSPATGSTCSTVDFSEKTLRPQPMMHAASPYNMRRRGQAGGFKGKALAPPGRSCQTRTRLPSDAPWANSATRPATVRSSRRGRRAPDATANDCAAHFTTPTGTPYMTIHKMDPTSRGILDAILLQDRSGDGRNAVPYKLIMAKLRNIYQGSEETLRGHHRRLVKPPHRRIRKPVWVDNDVELLKLAVRVCRKGAGGRIRWSEVSQFIQNNGGSYEFGVTTCSRKWAELKERDDEEADMEVDDDDDIDVDDQIDDEIEVSLDDVDTKVEFEDTTQYEMDENMDFDNIFSPE